MLSLELSPTSDPGSASDDISRVEHPAGRHLPKRRRWTRVLRSSLRCFFFAIRLRRFLTTEPIRQPLEPCLSGTGAAGTDLDGARCSADVGGACRLREPTGPAYRPAP